MGLAPIRLARRPLARHASACPAGWGQAPSLLNSQPSGVYDNIAAMDSSAISHLRGCYRQLPQAQSTIIRRNTPVSVDLEALSRKLQGELFKQQAILKYSST